MDYSITIYLDQRRPRKTGIYIVKIRVYSGLMARTEMYSTSIKLTLKEFELVTSKNPKGQYLEIAQALNKTKAKALNVAKDIQPFDFEKFEKAFYSEPKNKADVYNCFTVAIEENKSHGRLGNADNYQNSLNSIKKFVNESKKVNSRSEERRVG